MLYKIINTDNFDGDYPDESFVNLPATTHDKATAIARVINSTLSGDYQPRHWRVVEETYKLKPGFEP